MMRVPRAAGRRVGLLALAVALPAALGAQIPAREYAARRDALLAGIDSGVVVAFGAPEPVNYWPAFQQLPSFEYLTGFGGPDAALLLVKRGGARAATLFVPPRSPRMEHYVGARVGPAEAVAATGIAGRPLGELRAALDSLAAAGLPVHVVSDVQTGDYADADSLTRGARFVEHFKRDHPTRAVRSLDSAVTALRAKKSPAEFALLRRAAEVSAAAHREAMKAVAPGCGEYEIQALLEGAFRRLGGDRPAYGSIVGSGPNALVLHYMEDSRVMQDGEVLLIDAAASAGHYAADITRTMPVNGRFTPAQRDIYTIVLDAQAAFVRQIRPGAPARTAHDSGAAVVAAGLARLGLVESPAATFDGPSWMRCPDGGCPQVRLYALHGYGGHGIGVEVHDPAQYYFGRRTFEPGDAFTVEPGVYVSPALGAGLPDTPRNRAMLAKIRPAVAKYQNIGVRVEDDYFVTDRGLEWISSGVPRTIDEIEALMRERAPALPGGGVCGRPRS